MLIKYKNILNIFLFYEFVDYRIYYKKQCFGSGSVSFRPAGSGNDADPDPGSKKSASIMETIKINQNHKNITNFTKILNFHLTDINIYLINDKTNQFLEPDPLFHDPDPYQNESDPKH